MRIHVCVWRILFLTNKVFKGSEVISVCSAQILIHMLPLSCCRQWLCLGFCYPVQFVPRHPFRRVIVGIPSIPPADESFLGEVPFLLKWEGRERHFVLVDHRCEARGGPRATIQMFLGVPWRLQMFLEGETDWDLRPSGVWTCLPLLGFLSSASCISGLSPLPGHLKWAAGRRIGRKEPGLTPKAISGRFSWWSPTLWLRCSQPTFCSE